MKKALAAGLTAAMLLAPIQSFAADGEGTDKAKALAEAIVREDAKTIKDHELVAENDAIALYLYEPTLSLIVRDKKTGAIMESTVGESDGK